jgi:hypothetical protein
MDQFVKHARVSRVMLDDPSVNSDSDRALMTQMKPMVDVTREQQTRWSRMLTQMAQDALVAIAPFDPSYKEAVEDSGVWKMKFIWPSVLNKEDQSYQTMFQNRIIGGTISVPSYLEAMGTEDVSEELDRIRDDMEDPIRAAILSRTLQVLAQNKLTPPGPPQPKVNVSLRGDLTPQQEGNLAAQQGFNDGPFPASIGPQGTQGLTAGENADNVGFLNGNPFQGGTPINRGPDGQPISTAEAAQNAPSLQVSGGEQGPQPVSQTGSGATAVSAEGAIRQANQQGR